jgi:hypothetical protein
VSAALTTNARLGLLLEIGVDVQESVAIVKTRAMAAKALTKHGELGWGRSRGANGTSTRGSHSAKYLTARIARDRPDILERMSSLIPRKHAHDQHLRGFPSHKV